MPKFTRALTREIEIAGQRLTVTLDEKGVSIRPVGSRRAPAALPWTGVLCAALAEAPDEQAVSAALAKLGAGTSSTPSAPAAASLGEWLARLDRWLAKHRKGYRKGLLPGATPEQLTALEQTLGQPVPEELRVWLSWHNGQDPDLIGAFVESWNLMGVEEIAEEWKHRRKEEGMWNSAWIPLLDDGQGDLVCLDATQAGRPLREVWQGRTEHAVVSPSLSAWTAAFVQDVEAGRYHQDPERGEFQRR